MFEHCGKSDAAAAVVIKSRQAVLQRSELDGVRLTRGLPTRQPRNGNASVAAQQVLLADKDRRRRKAIHTPDAMLKP